MASKRIEKGPACKGCGAGAPKAGRTETIYKWTKKTGWDYIDNRSDRLACPRCLGDLQKRDEIRAKTS